MSDDSKRQSNLELRIRQLEERDARAAAEKESRRVFILFRDEDERPEDEPLARER